MATTLLHRVFSCHQPATGLLHGVERSAQASDGFTTRCSSVCAVFDSFTTWCRKECASRGEFLHGVVNGAQVRDGFSTRCSKGRASRGEIFHGVVKGAQAVDSWKNQFTKLIMSNMSFTFALFTPRKGPLSVERGERIFFYFERCYWHYLLKSNLANLILVTKMIAITPYFFGVQSCYVFNRITISIRGEGCYALSVT